MTHSISTVFCCGRLKDLIYAERVKRINPLNKTEEKYYAAPQYMEELTVLDLAKDIFIACTLNVTDVEAVLTSLVRKLPLYLKNGWNRICYLMLDNQFALM
ncbi:MAG: hypothetical protein J6N81_05750 [Treponema sp.]|nr:hypothetical protein [Treponema sp.]